MPAVVKDIIQQTQPAQQKASAQKNVSAFALVAGKFFTPYSLTFYAN